MIKDINNTIREQELKDTYYIVENTSMSGFCLKHALTGENTLIVFESTSAAEAYAKRNGWTLLQ